MSKKIPFVGLHAHSGLSVNDGLGYPQDHIEFVLQNGGNALALTDHGQMNGLPYQVLHAKKLKANGENFKPIFGVEAYFLPSLDLWREEYERVKKEKKRLLKRQTKPLKMWMPFGRVCGIVPEVILRR